MNIEEIRANAPEGATHYMLVGNLGMVYMRFNEDIAFYFDHGFGDWIEITLNSADIKPLQPVAF